MAHYQQTKFIEVCKKYFPDNFRNSNVLEVGSWNRNGSIRQKFVECEYTGIDVSNGPGVDLVCFGQDAEFKSNYFDSIISCECFEHNEYWIETFSNMIRMLKQGGACIITCASVGRGEHGTKRCVKNYSLTSDELNMDYYRNLDVADFKKTGLLKNFSAYKFIKNIYSKDLYFIGFKEGVHDEENFVTERLNLLENDAKNIKNEKRLSFVGDILSRLSWVIRYLIAKIVGERMYHQLMFMLKRF